MRLLSCALPIALVACAPLLGSVGHEVRPVPPARLLAIGQGAAGSSINVVANRRHALFTHASHQFAAYYDADGFMVLAHRDLASDRWRTRRSKERGNIADAHNSISLAVDGDGFLHVAWDHHGNALQYARSKQPLSLELGDRESMTSVAEGKVTYPEFYPLPDGDLLYLYRDGASGKGDLVINRYRTKERRWLTVQRPIISGEGKRSAYWSASVDRRGGLHLAWIWRESPDVASNHDIAYAFSPDGGRTWESAQGDSLTVPFTQTNASYAARIDVGHNLMNSPWTTVDDRGRPYILSYWSDAPGTAPQFRFLRYDSQQWITETVTNRSERFSLSGTATKRPPISRGVLLVEPGQERPAAHLIYRDDAQGGRALMFSTPAIGSGVWASQELTQSSLGAWEPVIDPVQWDREQQIHLLAQFVTQRDGDDTAMPANAASAVGSLIVSPRDPRAVK
jgi:hypothetical protein